MGGACGGAADQATPWRSGMDDDVEHIYQESLFLRQVEAGASGISFRNRMIVPVVLVIAPRWQMHLGAERMLTG